MKLWNGFRVVKVGIMVSKEQIYIIIIIYLYIVFPKISFSELLQKNFIWVFETENKRRKLKIRKWLCETLIWLWELFNITYNTFICLVLMFLNRIWKHMLINIWNAFFFLNNITKLFFSIKTIKDKSSLRTILGDLVYI